MDSFEVNKIVGAVLAALLIIIGMRVFMELGEEDHAAGGAHKSSAGYMLPSPENAAPKPARHAATAPATPAIEASANSSNTLTTPAAPAGFNAATVVAMIGNADVEAGKKVFKKCKACHSSVKGGPNKVGPNLWNVVDREKGAGAGFKYSKAMQSKGGKWSMADVVTFLHKPKTFLKGTKMSFSGIKKNADLANIVGYLRSLSDNPVPLAQ